MGEIREVFTTSRLKKARGGRLRSRRREWLAIDDLRRSVAAADPQWRAVGICVAACLATTALVLASGYLERHGSFITPYKSHRVSPSAYDLFLATHAAGLGILFGIYFTTAAVLFAKQPSMVGPIATRLWFVLPGTLMVYSVALLAAAAFGIRPIHGVFPIISVLDVASLLAFAILFGGLRREFVGLDV